MVAAVAFDKRLLLIGNFDPDKLGFREVQRLNKGEMTRSSIILLFYHFPIQISPSSVNVWLQIGPSSLSTIPKTHSERQISSKLAGWTPSFENFNLVHLLCPDCCISLFSSLFFCEYPESCQEALIN